MQIFILLSSEKEILIIVRNLVNLATFKDFKSMLYTDEEAMSKVAQLKEKVTKFALQYPIPGLELL